jgi:hypothetical protein
MQNVLIGIDPDVNKSGVCMYNSKTNFTLLTLSYFELFDLLKNTKGNIKVYIEAGWLNKSNWHKVVNSSAAINANIGLRTGANHEAGRKIVEMCEYLKLEYFLIKPTRSKINSDTFNKITGFKKRTNQEVRDAAMLVFGK